MAGGGAGIHADLKTFTALGVFGTSAITSVTAQNTIGVQGVHDLPPEFVGRQIDSVLEDIDIDAAKTGSWCLWDRGQRILESSSIGRVDDSMGPPL